MNSNPSFPRLIAAIALLASVVAVAAVQAAPPNLTESERRAYKAAFINVERGNWDAARRHAAQGTNPLLDKALLWYDMRRAGTEASFA